LEREDAQALVRAMERLREPDRLVIAYRYLFELSEAEMADALGVRLGTVKSRLSRAQELPDEHAHILAGWPKTRASTSLVSMTRSSVARSLRPPERSSGR
jgi:hypothetical protein